MGISLSLKKGERVREEKHRAQVEVLKILGLTAER